AFISRAGGPSLATFRSKIITGRNGGAWNGGGTGGAINSSVAAATSLGDSVGYGLGSQVAPTTLGPFSIAAGDTLIRYTLDGDANLDQRVDLTDFTILAANFNGRGSTVWAQADFNSDGAANLTDFTILAAHFNM